MSCPLFGVPTVVQMLVKFFNFSKSSRRKWRCRRVVYGTGTLSWPWQSAHRRLGHRCRRRLLQHCRRAHLGRFFQCFNVKRFPSLIFLSKIKRVNLNRQTSSNKSEFSPKNHALSVCQKMRTRVANQRGPSQWRMISYCKIGHIFVRDQWISSILKSPSQTIHFPRL